VMFMGKLHGLNHVITLAGHIAGTVPDKRRREGNCDKQQNTNDGRFDLVVIVFMKYLRQGYRLPVG